MDSHQASPSAGLERTRLNRVWLWKMMIFLLVGLGLGVWGVFDATVVYPRRGENFASYAQYQYLSEAEREGRLLPADLSFPDPAAELERMTIRGDGLGPLEKRRKEWFEALNVIGRLSPQTTAIDNPTQTLADLKQRWTTAQGKGKDAPRQLASYDIPVQWLIAVVGFGLALWLLVVFFRAGRVSYRWDAAEQRLHLPDGSSLVPADLEDVDKRLWHKFYVALLIRQGHPNLGGQAVKLDLYRYSPLESWILEMERTAFPDRVSAEEAAAPPAPAPAEAPVEG